MAEKQEHSSARDFHSCSSKLVCPVSLVSLLICTAALVRVEIINQRVHDVEDLVADARQNQNMIKDSTDATSFKRPERVESGGEFDHKITKEGRDETEVHIGRIRRFSSEAGTKPAELTMQSVRSEINKTLNSLRSRSFCSPKEQICVQGPPGLQGPKGSRGRRGPRGVSGRKGSSGSRGKQGPHGKQGIMGPPGQKGEQGIMGPPGQKGEQGIVGPPSSKGEQGVMGPPGSKGEQGIMGPPGSKGEQGIMGPLGLKGEQGIMGPPGQKGNQGYMGPPGQKGNQGYMGPTGTKGNQGIMGLPGQKGNQGFIGPAGPKGKRGYMGTFGPKGKQGIMGPVGRKGERGIMGPPGQKGKQGIMGPKGKQGITGFTGPRGIPGAKGEPGGSFSPPTMLIFPMKQTITKKHNAVFQCSVSGNPKPTVTWLGKSSAPLRSRDGRLDLRHVTFDDAGEYTCIGRNFLGITSRTAILIVKDVSPNLGSCTAVGVEDPNKVPDAKITASSNYLSYYPYNGRLNGNTGWCQKTSSITGADYLQVDMGVKRSICAVATQGKKNGSYVTSYKLKLSTDGIHWTTYKEQNTDKVFQANTDLNTIVQHILNNAAEARYVRFYPVTRSNFPCMRVEIYVQ